MKIIFSTTLLIVSIGYLVIATNHRFIVNNLPGEGFFPTIIGALLVITTSINLYFVVKERDGTEKTSIYLRDILFVMAASILFVVLFLRLGTILSIALYMIFLLFRLSPQSKLLNIVLSLGFSLSIYLLFNVFLNAGLPRGVISFF